MNWTSYASLVSAILLGAIFAAPSASAYFYSQTPESRLSSECGETGCFYDVTVEGNTFSVQYDIANDRGTPDSRTAQITEIVVDTGKKALVIDLNATYWGILYINVPRGLLDASDGGQDTEYTVFVNGQDVSDNVIEITKYVNNNAGDGNRVLSISYSQGQKQIEIIGTQIAPEFGPITAMIMGAAISGIIGVTIFARRRL